MGPGCPCSLWLTCAGRKCGGAGQVSAHLVQMLRGSAHLQLGAGRDAGHGVVLARGGGHSRAHPAVLQLLQLDMQLKRAKIPEFSAKFWLENVITGNFPANLCFGISIFGTHRAQMMCVLGASVAFHGRRGGRAIIGILIGGGRRIGAGGGRGAGGGVGLERGKGGLGLNARIRIPSDSVWMPGFESHRTWIGCPDSCPSDSLFDPGFESRMSLPSPSSVPLPPSPVVVPFRVPSSDCVPWPDGS